MSWSRSAPDPTSELHKIQPYQTRLATPCTTQDHTMHHIRPDQTILPLTRPHSTRATVHNASDQTTHQQTKHNRRQTTLKARHTSYSKLSAHRSQSNQVTTTESVVWQRLHSVQCTLLILISRNNSF